MATAFTTTTANPNLANHELIWLDQDAGNSQESRHVGEHLRQTFQDVKFYKQSGHCEGYIRLVPPNAHIVMIVSGRLGQEIVPRIHELPQVSSIYVYCMNKQKNEQWARPFSKIKDIIVSLPELMNKVRNDQSPQSNPQPTIQQHSQPNHEQNNELSEPISFDILPLNSPNEESKNSFIYSYYLLHCLLASNSSITDKSDLLTICKQKNIGNADELKTIEEFELSYFPSRALWWFTRPSSISHLLKKSFNDQNLELLLLYRFFLHDIQRQLEKNKSSTQIKVYYGQLMSINEIDLLKNNLKNFLIIHSFLFTTTKQQIQSKLSHSSSSNNLKNVLFEIEADPGLEDIKPFANIKNLSYFANQDYTLFMFGSIFRLTKVRETDDGMWFVQMALCSEKDHDLKILHEQYSVDRLLSYGEIFCQLKKFNQAEIFYKHLLKSLSADDEDIVMYYDALANVEKEIGNYDLSLQYLQKSMEIKTKNQPIDPIYMGDYHNNIGEVYRLKKDLKRASKSFDEAMTNYKKSINNDHPKVAVCWSNMGHVYMDDKKYQKALESYQKALVMRQNCLHSDHLEVAESHINIGDTYISLKDFDRAIDSYQPALQIYEKSDSREYFKIGLIQKRIAKIYDDRKQYRQARSYYEKAATNFRQVLSTTDPQMVQLEKDFQRVTANSK